MKKPGESLKIPDGDEKEIAGPCKHYFRRIPSLAQGEFIQWRTNLELTDGQRKLQKTLDIIAVLAFLVTAANLVVDIYIK